MVLLPSDLSFETVCNFMDSLDKCRGKTAKKRKCIEAFIENCIFRESGDAFAVFRLVLPDLDRERGNYRLKEAQLGNLFLKALGWTKSDPRAAAFQWRDPGHSSDSVGKLSNIIEEIGRNGACIIKDNAPVEVKKRLKVRDVNRMLDELVAAKDAEAKAPVIRYFLGNTTPRNLKWLVQIILKNARHGCGEGMILKAWHEDAKDYFDARGQDLRLVFNTMLDKDRPYTKALKLGMNALPQLASRVHSAKEALKKISRGEETTSDDQNEQVTVEPFLIETKFDGERIQVHRDGDVIKYFSRAAIDHGEASSYTAMNNAIIAATGNHSQIILDGELMAWNRAKKVMVPFGVLKRVFIAVREAKAPYTLISAENGDETYYVANGSSATQIQTQADGGSGSGSGPSLIEHRLEDLELLYIVFDLLYDTKASYEGSVVEQPLKARRELLAAAVPSEVSAPVPNRSGVVTRVIPLIPSVTTLYPGGPLLSWMGSTLADVNEAVETAKNRREEGVILKRLDSPWSINDRYSHSWLKIKPDYVSQQDIDAVIVGGFYGEGNRGGKIGQYVLALRSDPPKDKTPLPGGVWFATFCKVGTGLTDAERETLHDQLVNDVGLQDHPPHGVDYKSRCDVWVQDPLRSKVLKVRSDLRLISSVVYATPLSLRFPRIMEISSKPPEAVGLANRLLLDLSTQIEEEAEAGLSGRRRGRRSGGGRKKKGGIPEYLQERYDSVAKTDVECNVLEGMKVHVYGAAASFDESKAAYKTRVEQKLDAQHDAKAVGGTVLHELKGSERYVVALRPLTDHELDKIFCKPGKDGGRGELKMGVVTPEWVSACRAMQKLVPLRPRHLWHMSPQELGDTEVGKWGMPLFAKITGADVLALVGRHMAGATLERPVDLLRTLLSIPAPRRGGKPPPRPAVTTPAAREALESAQVEASRLMRHGIEPGPRLLLPWRDAELEARGKLDRAGSVLHGCTLLLLELPDPVHGSISAAAAPAPIGRSAVLNDQPRFVFCDTLGTVSAAKKAVEATRRLRLSRLRIQARQLGAAVVEEMSPLVTHIVGVSSGFLDGKQLPKDTSGKLLIPATTPAVLLRAVADRAGGARGVAALRTALDTGNRPAEVILVDAEWVVDAANVAATAVASVRYIEAPLDTVRAVRAGRDGDGDSLMIDFSPTPSEGAGPSTAPPAAPAPVLLPGQQLEPLEPVADVAIERPNPSNYLLMGSADMESLRSWPWAEHGAAEASRRPPLPQPLPAQPAVGDVEMAAEAEVEIPQSRRFGAATRPGRRARVNAAVPPQPPPPRGEAVAMQQDAGGSPANAPGLNNAPPAPGAAQQPQPPAAAPAPPQLNYGNFWELL